MADAYTIYIGSTFEWPFRWRQKLAPFAPINLAGMSFNFRLLRGSQTVIELNTGDAPTVHGSKLEIEDAVDGRFRLTITDEETDTWRPTVDIPAIGILKRTDSTGREKVLFKREFTLEKG